jgi:hypothetical protein
VEGVERGAEKKTGEGEKGGGKREGGDGDWGRGRNWKEKKTNLGEFSSTVLHLRALKMNLLLLSVCGQYKKLTFSFCERTERTGPAIPLKY